MKRPNVSLLALAAAVILGCAATARAQLPVANPALIAVDVYDRTDRTPLATFEKDGRRYVIGTPGHEYAVRIRNCTARRMLVVTSVDGVNAISGETASPDQSGYVIEPWGSVEIAGWRKSLAETAAFFFTSHRNSYAARTGRPIDVGVIGVAAFPEKPSRVSWHDRLQPFAPGTGKRAAEATGHAESDQARADLPASASVGRGEAGVAHDRDADAKAMSAERQAQLGAKLGTGHGRSENSPAQQVRFERESTLPAQTVALQYDSLENLVALGVLPPPVIARREPNPFPALRFAPDPPIR